MCAVLKQKYVWNHTGCDWMFYKCVLYLVYLCTRHFISAVFGSSFNRICVALIWGLCYLQERIGPLKLPPGGFSVRFFVMLKFDSKTELPCAKIWHRRVHRELDLLFKLKACEVGFWLSLGALAVRIVCFWNHCVSDAPLFCWHLRKKLQSEVIDGIAAGSEVWLIWCCCVFLLFSILLLNLFDLSVSFYAGYKSTISCNP